MTKIFLKCKICLTFQKSVKFHHINRNYKTIWFSQQIGKKVRKSSVSYNFLSQLEIEFHQPRAFTKNLSLCLNGKIILFHLRFKAGLEVGSRSPNYFKLIYDSFLSHMYRTLIIVWCKKYFSVCGGRLLLPVCFFFLLLSFILFNFKTIKWPLQKLLGCLVWFKRKSSAWLK